MTFDPNLFLEAAALSIELEWINSQKAEAYLGKNFAENRKKSHENIKRWSAAMNADQWCIGTDAIAFDVKGRLVNGQNRLTALASISTTTGFPFIVIRNLPLRSIQVLDLGRKRSMLDRMIIDGKQVDKVLLAGARWAMTPYNSNRPGVTLYSDPKYDQTVFNFYTALKPYFDSFKATSRMSGLFIAAGVRIYIDMRATELDICGTTHNSEIRTAMWEKRYPHGQRALERAEKFVRFVVDGIDRAHDFNPEFDGVAARLRELHVRDRSAGHNWNNPEAYRQILSAASHFMNGKTPKKLYTLSSDPFRTSHTDLVDSCRIKE